MKEKTKKILKGVGLALGSIAILALGVGIGACSVKNGSTQPITTTPIRKGLNQRPNKAPLFNQADNLLEKAFIENNVAFYGDFAEPSSNFNTYLLELGTGYYYLDKGYSDYPAYIVGFSSAKQTDLQSMAALAKLGKTNYPSSLGALGYLWAGNNPSYFYFSGGSISIASPSWVIPTLYLVDSLDVPTEDILELPDNWSPLRMVAKNVNKENNLIFDTDWNNWVDVPQANGQPMLDLSTILFKNQGRVYNHIYIYFKNLNGLKYATNSDNIGTGTATDWCADRVEYALVVNNSLKYNYLASSVGTSILQGQSVYNLGLNWSNPSSRKLEILDKRYPNSAAISNTLLGRFPRTATGALDPITGETIRPFGYGIWDYEYLFEYSNITSVDFVLGGSSDVFGLFTNAFNSVIPLLSVQVLPSISLGILLFLPLIGGIIVVIIRVIKK